MKKQQDFIYQNKNQYFAQISQDSQELGIQELKELGANRIKPGFRGIYFNATRACLYRVNYLSRITTRVLAPLISFRCPDKNALYKNAGNIKWSNLFKVTNTFAVFSNVSDSAITHSQYAGLCLKDAIVDQFRHEFNKRPDIDSRYPDIWISLYIRKNKATISIDTSGGSLHRRGYRKSSLEAPMQEPLAAAIIRLTGWDGQKKLYDPMCGSGTLLSEALMKYSNIPSAYLRCQNNKTGFGFEFLPDFDKMIWLSVKKKADKKIRPLPKELISGSDIALHAVDAAKMNNNVLPYGNDISIKQVSFQDIKLLEDAVIVSNPPYGIRMGNSESPDLLIKEFGDFLKQRCKGCEAYLYFGNRDLIKKMGLKASWKKPLRSGGLDGRLVKYELY